MRSTLVCAASLCAAASSLPAGAGEARRYYTDAKLATMRSNIAKSKWARNCRDGALRVADRWVKYDDERLRTLVAPPCVPRGYQVHNFGCPVHGVKVHEKGLYKWIIDFDQPYKITCPAGGEIYPSNDFAAYLASGMRDRSLLTGDYPDDGWGWNKAGDETNYWFVAYYAHWSMSQFLMPAIRDLGLAAVVAAEPERARVYAHKCALLLWQLAEYYPDYAYEKQSREGREHNPNYTGKWTNMIWEVSTPNICAPAYDAVRPFLAEDRELQAFTGKSAGEIDAAIRERLLVEAARCITDGTYRIAGNYGSHQRSLLRLATVLGETAQAPTAQEMIDYIVANPSPGRANDVGLRDALVNLVYRDGVPRESIGYNYGWVRNLSSVAEGLVDLNVNFFEAPRFRRLLTWPFDIVVAGQFVPPLGDSGDMFARGGTLSPEVARAALPYVRDPRMAAVLRQRGGRGGDLFSTPIEELLAEFPEGETKPAGVDSTHFPGYGLAYLQDGCAANRTASVLCYGDYRCHCHADQLNLLLFSHGNALLTDIGYPEQTDSRNHRRYAFFGNTVAHNTVVVDAAMQSRGPGKLHAFQPTGFAQVVDASSEAYGGKVSQYRRANMLVELSPTQSWLFDVFYVRGGSQHDYVALGAPSETSCNPALGPVQERGTLAGEDVPYAHFYDAPQYAAKPLGSISYGGYRGSGFQYLFNVRRAPFRDRAVFEWRLKAPGQGKTQYPWEGIGLRAHLAGAGVPAEGAAQEEVIACDGKPQKYKRLPDTIQFMIRRRVGKDLASAFVTVYEPYRHEPFIAAVRPVTLEPADGRAVAVRIELVDGAVHYAYHSLDPDRACLLDGRVKVAGQAACLVLDPQGEPVRAMLLNGTGLAVGQFSLRGSGIVKTRIASVDYAKGVVEVADPVLDGAFLRGQTALVAPNGFADSLTVQRRIDSRRFSIGDEDLRVAGGPVKELVPGQNRIVTQVATPHASPGMTVLNGRKQPQGRVAAGKPLTIDRAGLGPLRHEDFPVRPGEGQPRFTVVMAAPGDELWLPSLVEFGKEQ